MRIIIAGGAGFIGCALAKYLISLPTNPRSEVLVLDNLYRRGSEKNLEALKLHGVEFEYCDVKDSNRVTSCISNFFHNGYVDAIIDCVAEPSVSAGMQSDSDFQNLINTNLNGTINLLHSFGECNTNSFQIRNPLFIFLSTSRVYNITALNHRDSPVSEDFDTSSPRSFYGTTKLTAERFVEEICEFYDISYVINRCGIVAGPGQFGKSDQGIVSLWAKARYNGGTLSYNGFGGTGIQVRDAIHIEDLCELIRIQIEYHMDGNKIDDVYNVGGGEENKFTLRELTDSVDRMHDLLFRQGRRPNFVVDGNTDSSSFDTCFYVSDNSKVKNKFLWGGPSNNLDKICYDTLMWLNQKGNG